VTSGFLPPHHYDQVFTAHGVIMIFFVAMPFVTGLMNYVVPLQIGARDVAFPFLNNFSFWMTTFGALLVMASLFVGEFARTGWLAYPPLSGILGSPDVGVDYHLVVTDCRCRYLALRCEPDCDYRQDACSWHDDDENASVHLDCVVY
jgi:heme/copper-type cytochrome/quinol oxidase subunit 1